MSGRHSLGPYVAMFMVVALGMLLFYSPLGAAPPAGQPPFVDATVQREEMLRELRSIHELIKEQNGLLKELVQKTHGSAQANR